jgi:hypothetical protein
VRRAVVAVAAVACAHPPRAETIATPPAGISIAVYQHAGEAASAVIDDRRWVTIAGPSLVLEGIDPQAALPSLVIEPLGAGALAVGACARDRIATEPTARDALEEFGKKQERLVRERAWAETHAEPFPERADPAAPRTIASSTVRCAVTAAPGTYLVRVLYATASISYRAQHDVTMTSADHATIASRFAITPPIWGGRATAPASVRLFDGRPGGAQAPRELARGTIVLDGSTSVLLSPPRELPVRLRRVYDGTFRNGRDSTQAIWVWLEVDGLRLAPGPLHAHVEVPGEPIRDVEVPADGREQTRERFRAPLWIDEQLRGQRTRTTPIANAEHIVDRFQISVANAGGTPREVWIEEHLRDARQHQIVQAWPLAPAIARDRVQQKLVVPAGAIARASFTLAYGL